MRLESEGIDSRSRAHENLARLLTAGSLPRWFSFRPLQRPLLSGQGRSNGLQTSAGHFAGLYPDLSTE